MTPDEMRDQLATVHAEIWRERYEKRMAEGTSTQRSKDELDALTYAVYMGFREGYKHMANETKCRKWVGLTDEERYECLRGTDWQYDPEQYARMIEARLKEKNT